MEAGRRWHQYPEAPLRPSEWLVQGSFWRPKRSFGVLVLYSGMDLPFYERYLPHRLPPGHTFFITFRLAGSLPAEVVARLREEKLLLEAQAAQARAEGRPDNVYARQRRWFGVFDRQLDAPGPGTPAYLCEPKVAAVLVEALNFYARHQAYTLLAFCLMPNHVHLVVALPEEAPLLARTLQGLKAYTARHLNRLRQASGQVWQRESYDHRVRNADELRRIINYVLRNPVQAGLCAEWQHWPYTFLGET